MLDKNVKVFIVHKIFPLIMAIHFARKTQIDLLIVKKMQILTKIFRFFRCFLEKKSFIITKSNQVKLTRY